MNRFEFHPYPSLAMTGINTVSPVHWLLKPLRYTSAQNKSKSLLISNVQCIARHKRSFIKGQTTYNPIHYLSALKQKPGALRNGEPFLFWNLPQPIRQIQQCLLKQPKGDRAMVQLLTLIADYGEDLGVTAAAIALEESVPTVEAVLNIIHRLTEPVIPEFNTTDIPLKQPPLSHCRHYNSLLKEVTYAKS